MGDLCPDAEIYIDELPPLLGDENLKRRKRRSCARSAEVSFCLGAE
jgi:hypothetical protein